MKVLLFVMLLPLSALSQDLTGLWTGFLRADGKNLPYEIVINNKGDRMTGYSLTIFNLDGIENVGIKSINVRNRHGAFLIEDEKLLYNNYITTSRRIKLLGELFLRVYDTTMTLTGNFRTRTIDFREKDKSEVTGTITLKKLNRPEETKLITTLGEMNLLKDVPSPQQEEPLTPPLPSSDVAKKETAAPDTVKAAAELATRTTEVVQRVFFKSDSLILRLYDHGVIDGDTVSVVLNGKVIVSRQRLMGKPIISVIHATPDLGDSLLVVMYAESLGTIPPNTGILTVQDGDERYEVRFEGTKQKSSAILLTRKRR